MTDLFFTETIVTRFSHDLAGVMSAVSNSLSLLADFGGADEETLALATANAETLLARLRFFRAAFGSDGPITDLAAAKKITEDYLKSVENRSVRLSCVWETDEDLPLPFCRLFLLGAQIGAETLIRGGTITITASSSGVGVRAEGPVVKTDNDAVAFLNGTLEKPTPKAAPAMLSAAFAAENGLTAKVDSDDTYFSLTFLHNG